MSSIKRKIIIFDDEQDILSLCRHILEQQGWKVYVFKDCNHIIERVKEICPDLILMDNWIPNVGGIIATQTIKQDEELKHIPVIYFSANSDIEILAQEAGAETYLKKPFDLEELEYAINAVSVG